MTTFSSHRETFSLSNAEPIWRHIHFHFNKNSIKLKNQRYDTVKTVPKSIQRVLATRENVYP